MDSKVTIYDIARKLKITAATVSRALNNNPKISEKTRKLVLKTADEMNYKQNKLAKALKSGKSYNVGVIVPRIDSNFFASVIRGLEEKLREKGYHVIICQTHDRKDLEIENINSLLNAQVDGVLMSISNAMLQENISFQNLLNKNIPLIFFDRKKDIKGVSSVTIDDYKGGYDATMHLINQGCTRIAHITVDRKLEIYKNRYLGYKRAILDSGLPFDENLVIETYSKVAAGKETAKVLLQMDNRPDAIFSASDFSALGAIQEIKDQGLRIPEDISIVGFSNEPFTRFMELSISSVDQSPAEMGRITAQVFLDEVKDTTTRKKAKNVVLEPTLYIRESSLKKK